MFYPEESLKKGGRFYLCWVADSWPLRFATITHRQLWSQDIRDICDDLLQVMNNESGRPANRFSLRLSSQLMRGLVRLYQKKVTIMLSDLCMISARIMKNSNRKFNIQETAEETERQLPPLLELPAPVREQVPEVEERVEELIQQSGNAVNNVQDITLKEAAIPEFQLPPNDGFGEENPNQALQLLQDRTLEQMLGASVAASLSVLDAPLETTDKTHDSRRGPEARMERISDQDVTIFRKSTAQELLPEEFDPKEIPIPEIPPPDLPAPTEKELIVPEPEIAPAPEPVAAVAAPAARQPPPQEPIEVELEELEEGEPKAKRRRKHKLIVEKCTQITKKFLRARIENINVDLRCEDFSDDIVDLRVPADILLHRPAHAGTGFTSNLARELTRLFSRNLGYAAPGLVDQREMEQALASRGRRTRPVAVLENIPEEPPQVQEPQVPEPQQVPDNVRQQLIEEQVPNNFQQQLIEEPTGLNLSTVVPELPSAIDVENIADLPTQKLETASQKRTSVEDLNKSQAKRQKTCGFVSFRQRQAQGQNLALQEEEREIVEKENIPDNRQTIPPPPIHEQPIPEIEIQQPSDPEQRLSSLLQEAGLADMPTRIEMNEPVVEEPPRKSRRRGRESSESMLGSLDRTKVSLGDSEETTDSKRFIRDHWGTEGTMVKILKMVKTELQPITVGSLIAIGPVIPGHTRIIAARCFTSILKLKQHGFIKVRKDPDTLEVLDIFLGPKFDM